MFDLVIKVTGKECMYVMDFVYVHEFILHPLRFTLECFQLLFFCNRCRPNSN